MLCLIVPSFESRASVERRHRFIVTIPFSQDKNPAIANGVDVLSGGEVNLNQKES